MLNALLFTKLGHIIAGRQEGRINDKQITVADLTLIVIQDLQIAKLVYNFRVFDFI